MTADPVRGQGRWLAASQDRPDELRRQKGEGQHLAEVVDGNAITDGDGGKVFTFTKRCSPLRRPRDIGDQNIVSGRLRLANDQTSFDTAASLPERPPQRQSFWPDALLGHLRCLCQCVGV